MDTFLALILFGLAAVVSAILKRKQGAEQEPDSRPGQGRGTGRSQESPERRVSWEEELRRLLGGESSQAPPPPPPPLFREEPLAAPPPAPRVPRTTSTRPPPIPSRAAPSAPRKPLHTWKTRPKSKDPYVVGLQESILAYEEASQLDDQAKAKLQQAAERLRRHTHAPETVARRPEIQEALNLFQSPSSLRAAIIASVVLGTPKGME